MDDKHPHSQELKNLPFDALVGMLRQNREDTLGSKEDANAWTTGNMEFDDILEAMKQKFSERCAAMYWTHDGNVLATFRWIELVYQAHPNLNRVNFYGVGQNVEFEKDGVRHVVKPQGTLKFFDGEFDSWDSDDLPF